MTQDWFPTADADISPWLANFVNNANSFLVPTHLSAADLAPVQGALDAWNDAYSNHMSAQAQAQGARTAKDGKRDDILTALRPLVNRIQAIVAGSDEIRASLGLTVRSTS